MKAIVVFEWVFGNTHAIAEAVVEGLAAEVTEIDDFSSAATPPSRCSRQSPTNNYDSRRSVVEINRSNNNNQHQHQVSRKPGQVQLAAIASPRTSTSGVTP